MKLFPTFKRLAGFSLAAAMAGGSVAARPYSCSAGRLPMNCSAPPTGSATPASGGSGQAPQAWPGGKHIAGIVSQGGQHDWPD